MKTPLQALPGRPSNRRNALDASAAGDKVHDQRDDGKDQEEMNGEAGDVHNGETTDPKDDENDSEDEEHGNLLSRDSFAGVPQPGVEFAAVQAMREVNG
jgi:hypothetical protein